MRWQLHWFLAVLFCGISASAADLPAIDHFHKEIQPILNQYCSDCHADGANKGGVAFDQFTSDQSILTNRTLWFNALKNLRDGIMPPEKKARPTSEEMKRIEDWIKYDDFALDPKNPDPGRATIRRLNRVEYRNTIRDLMGVDFDTGEEFPADDTGYGFDNIGDVLMISPMLLEKYLNAAQSIVTNAVPTASRIVKERRIPGRMFVRQGVASDDSAPVRLSYYEPGKIFKSIRLQNAGHYELRLNLTANEHFVEDQIDSNRCRLVFKLDGQGLLTNEFSREVERSFHFQIPRELQPGEHELAFAVEPLTHEPQVRSLYLRVDSVIVRGPSEEKYQVQPTNYTRFFPRDVPKGHFARRAYARELLGAFATRAYRHPVDGATLKRLVSLAESVSKQRGKTFESGIAYAMTAVLASPQFLFREENIEPHQAAVAYPLVDEYTLASRLSYFLWSSMPDDELFRLASQKRLRENLPSQVKRMLADPRSSELIKNFVGQWLEARDIEFVEIDARAVLDLEGRVDPEIGRLRARLHELSLKPNPTAAELNERESVAERLIDIVPKHHMSDEVRRSMRREEELYFEHIVRDDRNVMELVDSDYTYLNQPLADHYGLTNLDLTGPELVRVSLPTNSPRGGVLTMGGILAVTSNPTRTSPVKRGLFILDNILGITVPPPPPNLPLLEDSDHEIGGRKPTLREVLAIHREKPMCNSCHSRMDPLGLALENFNAMGMWREKERDQPIEAAGKLITGESFQNIRELKHILATKHRLDFYRTLTGKLLTYALGRGLEYYDTETVDQIVNRLDRENGRFSALLSGVIESAPFQKRRNLDTVPSQRIEQRAENKRSHEHEPSAN